MPVRPRARIAVLAAVAVVAVFAAYAIAGAGAKVEYGGGMAPRFSFRYEGMERVRPHDGELVRLEGRSSGRLKRLLTVRPLRLGGVRQPVSTALPFAAHGVERQLARDFPGYRLVVEGRTRLEVVEGREAYMVGFVANAPMAVTDGMAMGPWAGKALLVAGPGDAPRSGVAIELAERLSGKPAAALRRAPAGFLANWPSRFWVQQRTAVDAPTPLERPLRTFGFD